MRAVSIAVASVLAVVVPGVTLAAVVALFICRRLKLDRRPLSPRRKEDRDAQ